MAKLARTAVAVTLGMVALAATAAAQTVPAGSGTLTGRTRLHAAGCAARVEHDPASFDVELLADGEWSAEDDAGREYSGSSNTAGRKTTLVLDAEGMEGLEAILVHAASLCPTEITLTRADLRKFTLIVDKRMAHAHLRMKANGSAEEVPKATVRVDAKGDWGPLG